MLPTNFYFGPKHFDFLSVRKWEFSTLMFMFDSWWHPRTSSFLFLHRNRFSCIEKSKTLAMTQNRKERATTHIVVSITISGAPKHGYSSDWAWLHTFYKRIPKAKLVHFRNEINNIFHLKTESSRLPSNHQIIYSIFCCRYLNDNSEPSLKTNQDHINDQNIQKKNK